MKYLPVTLGSLEQDLPEGEFLTCIHITHRLDLFMNYQFSIDEQVQNYLRVLPKGTELVSITECAITGLSKPYEVRFRNPILRSIKEVKLEHVRVYDAIDDKLVELNLLTGIKYIKRDGTTL